MPEFKKSKGFKMKGPTFFASALKKYGKAPLKHDGSTPAGDMDHTHKPGDAGQAKEIKPMTSPQVGERETQPGDAGQMKSPTKAYGKAPVKDYDVKKGSHGHPHGKPSPAKGLKDMLGKVKDKLSGGPGAGAGIGMMLGGPLGAAIGGGIGAIRKKRQAKKAAAAEQPGAAPAGVPGAGAGSPEPVPSPMGKRGKKRKAKKGGAAALVSGALMGGAMRTPTKKKKDLKKQSKRASSYDALKSPTGEKTGETYSFTKGARTKTGTYGPKDKAAEKGKKKTYYKVGDTYMKTVEKKKKGATRSDKGPGMHEGWKAKKSKEISAKKYKKQVKKETIKAVVSRGKALKNK